MRKAVAQVASKARGNSSKRSRDDTNNNNSSTARAASPLKSSRGKESPSAVKSHTKMSPDEAALAAKNYRLAKELSELRVRHREESKTVTKLTMENMTLASKCREVMREAALYKQQLDQQRADMADLQRQQSTPALEMIKGSEPVVSPVLVSSDDLEEDGISTSIESEVTPPVTPLLSSSKEESPREAPLVQATVNPHRFFPPSASPKNLKTAYNEEFPGDITAAAPSRRVNFQRMGSFEELECEDDMELDTAIPSPPREATRHRDAPGLETKEKTQRGFRMSSLDAFEASFQTDIARSFSASDTTAPPSDEIYDPFSNSPVKIDISAVTPIIDKPYEAELPPRSPSRGAFASDPPGVDKTSTRPNGPLYKEEKSAAKGVLSPPRTKATSTQSAEIPPPQKNKVGVTSPSRVQPVLSKVATPVVLSEQSKNDSNRVSLAEQVLTVQSKAAILLSTPESPKAVEETIQQSKGVSTRESSTAEPSPKSGKQAVKVKSKELSPREAMKRDKKNKQAISARESLKVDESAQIKIDSSLKTTLESLKVDKELRGSASKPPRIDKQTVREEKPAVVPLPVTTEALPDNSKPVTTLSATSTFSEPTVDQTRVPPGVARTTSPPTDTTGKLPSDIVPSADKESSPKRSQEKTAIVESTKISETTEKPLMDKIVSSTTALEKPSPSDRYVQATTVPSAAKEISPKPSQKKTAPESIESSQTTEKPLLDKIVSPEKLSPSEKYVQATPTIPSDPVSPVSPIPSVQRIARVTPSPGLPQVPKPVRSELAGAEPLNSRPIEASMTVDGVVGNQSSKTWPISSAPAAPSLKPKETYSVNLFASEVPTPEKKAMVSTSQSPSWVKSRSVVQDGPVQGTSLKTNASTSIFPKTSPSFLAPKVIETPTFNGNDSSSSIRSHESNYRGSSSPFRKTFGEVRSTWAHNSASEVKTVSPSVPLSPSASARSWQKSSSDFRPSWSHDRNTARVEAGSSSKSAKVESRPWQTAVNKSSFPQQEGLPVEKAPSLSSIHRNSYIDNHSPVQTFKPSMTIKELAAAFESRTPDKSYVTYSDASTPSDEEFGDIPMVSPPRVEEVRKSLNSQFGQ